MQFMQSEVSGNILNEGVSKKESAVPHEGVKKSPQVFLRSFSRGSAACTAGRLRLLGQSFFHLSFSAALQPFGGLEIYEGGGERRENPIPRLISI